MQGQIVVANRSQTRCFNHDWSLGDLKELQDGDLKELEDQGLPTWISQQILCFYFQKQQQSHFINKYNADDPNDKVLASDDEEEEVVDDERDDD